MCHRMHSWICNNWTAGLTTGETALHKASRFGHVNVITGLVERGADINCLTKVGGVHSIIVEDGMLSL